MSTAIWDRVRLLAGEALDLPEGDRRAFLEHSCEGDASLRAEVDALLSADARAAAEFLRPLTAGFPDAASAAPAATDSGWLVGKHVGRYRVKRLIGAGGMGAVYEALQEQPRRVVALKVVRPGFTPASALRRFEQEAEVLGRLRHPGIAQIYEAGLHETETGALSYFAMEYVIGGKPITAYAAAKSLPVRRRLELFAEVCDAAHHGHQKGVVHRDLKPDNILVDGSGRAKIIDFGVARALDADPLLSGVQTGAGQVIGTLAYMAPEQCAGDPHDLDTRGDVYALGVVLYELLTGRLPLDVRGVPPLEAVRRIRDQTPAPLSAQDRALRGDAETIVLKALQKERERRYQSAAELRADIVRYLRSEPIAARPPGVVHQVRLLARRRRGAFFAAAVLTVGLLVGLGGLTVGLVKALHEAERARHIADFLKSTIRAGALYQSAGPEEDDPAAEMAVQGAGFPETGRDYTVREMLSRAAVKMEEAFPEDPLIVAELSDLFGATLSQYGVYPGSDLLKRAVELRRKHQGPDHPETIRSEIRLGLMTWGGGNYFGAGPYLRSAYESRRRTLGDADPRTLRAGQLVADNLNWQGRPAEAVVMARQLHASAVSTHGDLSRPALEAELFLARMLLTTGEFGESERRARSAYNGLRRTSGPDSPAAVNAAFTLAGVLVALGKDAEALPFYRGVAEAYARRYGESSARLLGIRVELARALSATGADAEAADIQRSVLSSALMIYGPESATTYRYEFLLARFLLRAGADLEEAERLARLAEDGYRRAMPPEDAISILYADTVAAAVRQRGRPQEAERRVHELLAISEGHGSWAAIFLRRNLGLCLRDQGRLDESARELLDALGHTERMTPPDYRRRREIAGELAAVYESLGRAEEAARWRHVATAEQ